MAARRDLTGRSWWERSFAEREALFRSVFGETSPPGCVSAFAWDDIEVRVPGGCAMVFPPAPPNRREWFTVSHGLTQPIEEHDEPYDFEYLIRTKDFATWPQDALYGIMSYIKRSRETILPYDRIPLWLRLDHEPAGLRAFVGKPHGPAAHPFGEMRAMMFFSGFRRDFSTSTGVFDVLTGSLLTAEELQRAKSTSSAHVLLLFIDLGVGIVSDPLREDLFRQKRARSRWSRIMTLSVDEAERQVDLLMGR